MNLDPAVEASAVQQGGEESGSIGPVIFRILASITEQSMNTQRIGRAR